MGGREGCKIALPSPSRRLLEATPVGTPPVADVTGLLLAWRQGDGAALERLLPLVYNELHRIAHARMRDETPGHQTLQTTALVHETYLRLVEGANVAWQDRVHFYAVCARLMRRVLIDRARERRSLKRGGDEHGVPYVDWLGAVPVRDEELLALDEALDRLSTSDARMGRVVELRYFAGLNVEETAEVLGVSSKTVKRDWQVARAWLHHELGDRGDGPGAERRTGNGG
jgi:RNA polymerase sigma-70 factor, ECF subfamily